MVFGTAENILKTMSKECTVTVFETIWNCREPFENNVT